MNRTPPDAIARLARKDDLDWDVDANQLVADYLVNANRGESIDAFAARWLTNRTLPPL